MITKFAVGYNFTVAGLGFGIILGSAQFNLTLLVLSAFNLLIALHLFSKYDRKQEVTLDAGPESTPPAA